jgi:site-specific recombinase XerC
VATTGPYNVATYIETRSLTHSAPDVKQQLAAVRTQFDWLINGEVVLTNPVAAIRGPQYVVPNPGALEHTQEMAAHESACTTKLCDRTKERLTRDEMERIRL